jgi:signal peptidase I
MKLSDVRSDLTMKAQAPAPEKPATDWVAEIKGLLWLVLAVLAVWSFVAKPFYIPSESMMPTLIKGDRLVVTKYPYGWSYVSPSPFHVLPFINGRLFGRMPERGDVVIVKPPTADADYIKRVIGLPGDRIAVREGVVFINGTPLKRVAVSPMMLPVDDNLPCNNDNEGPFQTTGQDGKLYCALPRVRETLPNGVTYDTIDLGYRPGSPDDFAETLVPAGHVFLMGDNRDESADSRVSSYQMGLGGPVPWENLGGRAEFITFSYDGSTQYLNPLTWVTALRGGRAGTSLRPHESAR